MRSAKDPPRTWEANKTISYNVVVDVGLGQHFILLGEEGIISFVKVSPPPYASPDLHLESYGRATDKDARPTIGSTPTTY